MFKDVVSNDIELLEAATAAMRAILQRLAEVRANCNFFKQLTFNDVQPMLNGARQCSNANVRVNLIRMLCNLVQIMINNEILENSEMIKVIVSGFLRFLTKIFFKSLTKEMTVDSLFLRFYWTSV